jgi:ATP-binding cassette subfamily B protein
MLEATALSDSENKPVVHKARLLGMWRMMSGFRFVYLGATIALGLAAVAKTSSFLLLRDLIDEVLLRSEIAQAVLLIALTFVGLAAVEGMFTYLSGRLTARTAEGITRRLREQLFDHIQRLSFSFHNKAQTGDLIQRVTSDVSAIQRFFAEQAIEVGRILLLFSINFIALMALNLQLALVSTIIVPVLSLISFFFFRRISKLYQKYQEQDARLSTVLQENLSGVRVVKAFARQDYETSKFEDENHNLFVHGRDLLKQHAYYWPVTDIVANLQIIAGYTVGALMVINGTITVGTYLAYAGMIHMIIHPMRGLGRLIVQASTGLVSYQRILDILDEQQEPLTIGSHHPTGDVTGEIIFDHVGFEYESDQSVLEGITFRAEPGQVIALLGSTGSGKTTLVNLLPRFFDYTSGLITLDGVDLKHYSREYLRRQIGIVEQEPFLFSRSIRENITYGVGRQVSDEEVIAAAQAAAIHDVVMSFPEDYKTVVGERGVTLSGGQKQRVAIARTILKNPRILLLDDATSSVDTETEAEIRVALERLMRNRTTFIIAHRIQSVMNADLILVLDKGRIVQRGTHDDLVNQPGIYQQIYDLQARIELDLEREIAGV